MLHLLLLPPLQRKGRFKMWLRDIPLLFWKLEKRSKDLVFLSLLGGILPSEKEMRSAEILILRPKSQHFGTQHYPSLVSHFYLILHVPSFPSIFYVLFPLVIQFLFTYERKKVKSLSRVRLFATPWTVAYQAPPSMGFSRQEYWSGLPFPSPFYL